MTNIGVSPSAPGAAACTRWHQHCAACSCTGQVVVSLWTAGADRVSVTEPCGLCPEVPRG